MFLISSDNSNEIKLTSNVTYQFVFASQLLDSRQAFPKPVDENRSSLQLLNITNCLITQTVAFIDFPRDASF